MDNFLPELVYPLLVLRQNIYTDPQKPIQVQPGLYEINDPKPEDPVLVTTNFSINFLRRPPPGDVVARARILKLGRRLAVGEVHLHAGEADDLVAHVTSTYSIPPRP